MDPGAHADGHRFPMTHTVRTQRRAMVAALLILLCLVTIGAGPSASSPPAVSARFAASGETAWPLEPRGHVVHGFDPPDSPWEEGHRGVDVAGTAGQVVRASRTGTVSFVGTVAGKPVVVISHGATRTTYEPVRATVSVGHLATAGTPVGRLTVLHSHCFPAACLHWGLRSGRDYVDPLVGFPGPVRLLPLTDPPLGRQLPIPRWAPPLSTWAPPAGVWRAALDAGA